MGFLCSFLINSQIKKRVGHKDSGDAIWRRFAVEKGGYILLKCVIVRVNGVVFLDREAGVL